MPNELWYQLPSDMNAWQSIIVNNLARKVPEIPPYIAGLEFSKLDPVLGDADGLVYLLNGMAGIPVLIRNYRLAPLDIMVDQKENFYPVSGEFLNKLYADNTIAEPSDDFQRNNGIQEDGPARRLEAIRTVDSVKRASVEVREKLASAVENSPRACRLMDASMPEVMNAIFAPQPEPEKEAAEQTPEEAIPQLHFLACEHGDYYFNGEKVDVKVAGEFLDAMNATEVARIEVMQGAPMIADYREKHASLYMGGIGQCGGASVSSPFMLATVLGVDKVPRHGIVLRKSVYVERASSRDVNSERSYDEFIYVGPDCHSIQRSMMLIDPIPMDAAKMHELSVSTEPAMGAYGVCISGSSFVGPFEIIGSLKVGSVWEIRTSDSENKELTVDQTANGWTFYAIPREEIGLVKSEEEAMHLMPGENYSVGASLDGNLIIGDRELSYANAMYELMDKHAMAMEDAGRVIDVARGHGRAFFKVAKSEPEKGNKSDTTAEGVQPAVQPLPIQPNVPVNFDDIEDIAKVNDPSLMSAYLSGKLVDVNIAGKEQLMQIADDLMEAIKSLGKLLFLIRMGSISNVSEEDAQMALNKMSDVAKAIGTAPIQTGY